ncbi:hypothetical protein GGQ84_002065 [Desulfitispora alkaliphila]
MDYLVTWIEGEEVHYKFTTEVGLSDLLSEKHNCIYTKVN